MPGSSTKLLLGVARLVETRFPEAGIGVAVIRSKIEIPLNEQRPGKCVIAHTVAAHPGVEQGQGKGEQAKKNARGQPRTPRRAGIYAIRPLHDHAAPRRRFPADETWRTLRRPASSRLQAGVPVTARGRDTAVLSAR